MFRCLLAKLLKLAGVISIEPARRINVNRLINRLYFVFIFKPVRDHIKLQLANRPNDEIRGINRRKYLRRPLL